MIRITIMVVASIVAAPVPVSAQQLENSTTPATAGTNGKAEQGRASGANLSASSRGPASETTVPTRETPTNGRGHGPAQAGASDATRELFQH